MSPALLVLTTLPDPGSAEDLARGLVEERLAACVHVGAAGRSVYRWQGAVQSEAEVPLWIKTTAAAWPALRDRLHERHPYELPEILAVDIRDGLPAYLAWLDGETQP